MHLVRDALPPLQRGTALSAAAVCLGSPFRGDDAVGPVVADRRRAVGAPLLDCGDEPTRLLDLWAGLDVVVVVDALRSDAPPGTLHRVEVGDGPLPRDVRLASTHAMGIVEALELGRALGRVPHRVVVLGIEGASFGMGQEMTPEVARAIDVLVPAVVEELGLEGPCTSGQ